VQTLSNRGQALERFTSRESNQETERRTMQNIIFFGMVATLLTACTSSVALPPDQNVIPSVLSDIPLYPGTDLIWEGIPGRDTPRDGHTIYSYIAQDERKSIEKFYRENMQIAGWELLGAGDDKTGVMFWFAKEDRIVSINIFPWSVSSYMITIDITTDPAYGELPVISFCGKSALLSKWIRSLA
jgi:hypothetical protein